MTATARRRIIAWASISIDGYTSGPQGPAHDTWLYAHAGQERTAEYFEGVWRGADTALLGRTNYEGFAAVWPAITRDPATDARTRDLGTWLESVEKVVLSRTLERADWENSRIARDLVAEAEALRSAPGRDVLVLNSASVIQALLRADLLDDLRFAVVPCLLGGGLRLFSEGLPASGWTLVASTALAHGAVGVHYRRG
ncbi:dihydrofolate reductase family protein [Prauserella cavernicola]|uniref:Dihydrofolate reductase family protein n=1 Tax=Prauserella cavernicola TaxID=2800127 RepID=A0A934QNQ4_9PSEU|nr:dihydrofolate reductase family protein [Prauserella cavernicola]MBK1783271.1 dihydrofolate reductase family protein [Prauserella cavernicola]